MPLPHFQSSFVKVDAWTGKRSVLLESQNAIVEMVDKFFDVQSCFVCPPNRRSPLSRRQSPTFAVWISLIDRSYIDQFSVAAYEPMYQTVSSESSAHCVYVVSIDLEAIRDLVVVKNGVRLK
jgi:hypothetical protein